MVPAAGQLDDSGSGVGGKAGSSVDAVSAVVGTDGTGAMAARGIATPRSSLRGSSRSVFFQCQHGRALRVVVWSVFVRLLNRRVATLFCWTPLRVRRVRVLIQ